MRKRLKPVDISFALRMCVNYPGDCKKECPYGDSFHDGSCVRLLNERAAELIENQAEHIRKLIQANEAHHKMVCDLQKGGTSNGSK